MRTINTIGTIFCTDSLPAVTTDRVRSALDRSRLDPSLARDLAKRFCFVRAKNRLRADGLIDEVSETEARWTWQLSRRYREENRLGYEFEAAFWYDKGAEDVGADNLLLLERVRELFAKYGGLYLPSDVTKIVRRIFDRQKGMVPLRHHGVLYFVPDANRDLMKNVGRFINEIGGECISADIGTGNGIIRDKALDMLVESVRSDLSRITGELRSLRESGEDLTPRKAGNRWRELVAQLDRVKLFASSLRSDAETLLTQSRLSELDLTLVCKADLDVIAALAHAGKVNGALGTIAKTAYAGELPPLDSPRVQAVLPMLDLSEAKLILPVVLGPQPALAV